MSFNRTKLKLRKNIISHYAISRCPNQNKGSRIRISLGVDFLKKLISGETPFPGSPAIGKSIHMTWSVHCVYHSIYFKPI